jgi:hypothetical protein
VAGRTGNGQGNKTISGRQGDRVAMGGGDGMVMVAGDGEYGKLGSKDDSGRGNGIATRTGGSENSGKIKR